MSAAYDAEIDEMPEEEAQGFDLVSAPQSSNLADELSDEELTEIGRRVVDEFEIDERSLRENGWSERLENAMKLAMLAKEAKTYPWPNASNVKFPLLITAAIQFNARAYPAIVDGFNVVKGKVLGEPNDQKRDRAERIGRHMSWQLLEEMKGWEEDTDRLLLVLPIVGSLFRKTYFDPIRGYNCSHIVLPDKFVVNYWARDLDSVPRVTQVCEYYPNEIETRFRSSLWTRQELGRTPDDDDQAPHEFLEQHRLWDLDEDGYEEPYIVTVHRETAKVVRIVARFDADKIKLNQKGEVVSIEPVQYFTKYSFLPSPDGGFYDMGFGTLLHPLNETLNTTINQLMDAGHLANVQGGFIGAGVSIKSGNLRFQPGEWKKVDATGAALAQNVVPLPVKEPSAVLFNLLGTLIEATKEVTATKDILTGDQPANTPVGTTLALIEQGLKVFSAIYKRIHRALKHELGLLYRLNSLYLDPQVYFTFQDKEGVAAQADYAADDVDVLPVSDPTVVTDMQRIHRAQFLMQFRPDPLMNGQEINRRVLEAASIPDVKELFAPPPSGPPPEMMAKMAELEAKNRDLEIKAAQAVVSNAKTLADILAVLSNLGKSQQKGPSGETQTVDNGIDPAVPLMAQQLLQAAHEEMNGQVQQPDVRGVEGAPADAGVSPVPQGPAGSIGPAMVDNGSGVIPGAPDQGPPDGGAGPVGMG